MCELLDGVEGVLVYMDDILIYGESESKHDESLNKVLSIVKSSGLKLNKKKCIFKVRQVTFLGHLVTDSGISATPDKIEAISQLEPPKNVKRVAEAPGNGKFLDKICSKCANNFSPFEPIVTKGHRLVVG